MRQKCVDVLGSFSWLGDPCLAVFLLRLLGIRYYGALVNKAGFGDWGALADLDDQIRKYHRVDIRKYGVGPTKLSLVNKIFRRYEIGKPKTGRPKKRKGLNMRN